MAAASTLKPFTGTFLVPGVSLNRRLYTKEMIGKAVARMKARIADPDGLPIVMRTFHGAGDDSRLITARVIEANQAPDGSAKFEARWYDTAPARDIAALVQPADGGPPALKSVSIHGYFLGETKTVDVDGEPVLAASDLEVDFIDFTATPGVVKALIDAGESAPRETAPSIPGRTPISETWEVFVQGITEEVPLAPLLDAGDAVSASAARAEAYTAAQKRDALDKGQAMKNDDGEPSYTIKNKSDLRRAIRAVGRGGADHDAIRKHVMDRAAALGLSKMIPGNWNKDGTLKESAGTRFGQVHECYDSMGTAGAGFAIDAYNGPVSLTLRAPSLDPSSLRAVAAAAMTAAMDALGALDPDFDADIDVPGAPAEDSDDDMAEGAPQDPQAATADDDEDHAPGSGCPCGCGCAVPGEMAGGTGCPCTCGCEVCGASVPESAASTAPQTESVAFLGEPGPEPALPAGSGDHISPQTPGDAGPAPTPDTAPDDTTPEESAVSETVTPAAEAATTPTPAPVINISMTQEQFAEFIATFRAPAAESAPAPAAPVEEPATPAAPAAEPAPAPAQESFTKADVAAAVAEALAGAIPALRDQIVSQYGLPPRTGIRTSETDRNKAEMTPADMWENRADLLLGNLGKAAA